MDLYKFFKTWRGHTDPTVTPRQRHWAKIQILNEISQHSIDKIEGWMDDAGPGSYTFDHMFGGDAVSQGQWRRSFPIATKDQRVAVDMMQTLHKLDWEPAFEKSGESYDSKQKKNVTRYGIYVKKESEYTIPKGPRAGETTTKVDKRRIAQAI